MFYIKDGVEYIKKSKQFYGGEITLEDDMKVDNLDLILDLVDDYIDLVENCPCSINGEYRGFVTR
jgi:hypothetical protein